MVSNRNLPAIILATLLGGIAAALIFFATSPDPPITTVPTSAIATPTSTDTTAETTTTLRGPTLTNLLPADYGTLYATVNEAVDGLPMRLFTWSGDQTPVMNGIAAGSGPAIEFDADGTLAAFIGVPPWTESGQLFLRSDREPWFPFSGGVAAFAWHQTEPAQLAWQTRDQLCRTNANSATEPEFECILSPAGQLIGYGNRGFLVRSAGEIQLVDLDGNLQAMYVVENALFSPDDQILLIEPFAEGDRSFMLVDTEGEVQLLPWAPADASGGFGIAAWSPDSLLAFLRYPAQNDGRVSIYWPRGRHVSTHDLPGRFWNLRWTLNGRYIVLPGVIDDQDHVVLVLDVLTGEQVLFPHPT